LLKRWLCDYSKCLNRNHHCWQSLKNDNHHYKLFNDHIIRWNDAINQKLTTMKISSSDLKERLFLFDEKQRLIKKKNRKMNQKNTFNNMNVRTSQNFQSFVSIFIEVFALASSSIDQQIELLQQLQQLVQAFTTQQILQTYRFSHESSHSYVQQFSLSMLILSHELYFSSFLSSSSIHSAYSTSFSNFLNSFSSFYQSISSSMISSSSISSSSISSSSISSSSISSSSISSSSISSSSSSRNSNSM
jgi:hypothetical protein